MKEAGQIFNWGTTKLYLNNPDEYTRHNIYMYLLLGDPTADYKEEIMPTQTKVGFVMMLDTSGTMRDATAMVKIDAKAFVREARQTTNSASTSSMITPVGSIHQMQIS